MVGPSCGNKNASESKLCHSAYSPVTAKLPLQRPGLRLAVTDDISLARRDSKFRRSDRDGESHRPSIDGGPCWSGIRQPISRRSSRGRNSPAPLRSSDMAAFAASSPSGSVSGAVKCHEEVGWTDVQLLNGNDHEPGASASGSTHPSTRPPAPVEGDRYVSTPPLWHQRLPRRMRPS